MIGRRRSSCAPRPHGVVAIVAFRVEGASNRVAVARDLAHGRLFGRDDDGRGQKLRRLSLHALTNGAGSAGLGMDWVGRGSP